MSSNDPKASRDRISDGLGELRGLLRSTLTLRGASILVLAASVALLVSLGIDRAFRLSTTGRTVALSIYALGLVVVAWRYLLRPLFSRFSEPVLADLLESRFPKLGDTVRSAVAFTRARGAAPALDDDTKLTRWMEDRVIAQAAERIRTVDRREVIEGSAVLRAVSAGVVGLALVGAIAVASPGTLATWFERNLLFSNVEWPYRTELVVEGFTDGVLGVPRDDPLEVRVAFVGEDPVQVTIHLQYESERLRYELPREGEVFVYEHAAVTEPFEFTVEGGDFESRPYRVEVLERPVVESIAARVTPPEYTERPAYETQGELGELAIPAGSEVRLTASSNKELARAWLETEGREVELTVSGRSFEGSWSPDLGGMVVVHLADVEGVPPDRLFRFTVHPVADREPKVRVAIDGLGSLISPVARMPLEIQATDDYRIDHLRLAWQVVGDEEGAPPGVVPLDDPEEPAERVDAERVWEVSSLAIEPEKRLNVRIGAVDNDGLAGAKTGYSAVKSFLVVSLEKLGEEFVRREEEQRRALERVLEEEKLVRDGVYELIGSAWKTETELGAETLERMMTLTRVERQHSRQVGAVADAVRQILTEMENNRAAEADQLDRLATRIVDPLRLLGETSMTAASLDLGRIRDADLPTDRVPLGLALAERIEEHIRILEEVISQMARLESFTEIVKFLRVTINTQDEAIQAARTELDSEVEGLFHDGGGGLFEDDPEE